MSDWRTITRAASATGPAGETVLARARWCQDFWCHFMGLQFRRSLPDDEGLLFVFNKQSVAASSIHMFFVFFPIAAVWLDDAQCVVDATLARPWRPAYAPAKPARYLIEARPSLLDRVQIGDRLAWDQPAEPRT